MRNKPKQPTGIIIGGIIATIIIAAIGFGIMYAINQQKKITPSESEAATCCTCTWSLELSPNEFTTITEAVGLVVNNFCTFAEPEPSLGSYNLTSCSNIPLNEVMSELPAGLEEDTDIFAEENRGLCSGGCTFHTSDPILPPSKITEENNDVTFTTAFELRYAIEPHTEYTDAEMIIMYPNDTNSPEPIEATSLELVTTLNEGGDTESGNLPIKIYKAMFDTTWDTVLNPATAGMYTVSFRAKDNSPEETWTETSQCKREFEVVEVIEEGEYCYSLDAVPVSGYSPFDVTLTVDAGVPDSDPTAVYEWQLDLNCNGTIDEGTGENAEIFTTPTTTNSITKTFTTDEVGGQSSCDVDVAVIVEGETRTLDELSPGSCSSSVSISSDDGDTCGNGTCDTDELCDPNGNIACPAGGPLSTGLVCRDDCTYCGDGSLDTGETCDPGIPEGQTGYDPLCQADCSVAEDGEGICGDGVLDTGEACDPAIPEGQAGYDANCQSDCTIGEPPATCGDGVLDPGEACDPAIPEGQAGYNANCQSDCTIGIVPGSLTITQQAPQCLEMVAPNNLAQFTITVSNGTTSAVSINAISDTLPQGLAYTTGSSTINGVPNSTDEGVVLEMSGSSQLVTWNNSGSGWTIEASQSVIIAFSATAGSSATVGLHPNVITVTPSDGNPIPGQVDITIAQTCTQPLTGIFDRNVVIILGGLFFLFLAGGAYYSGFGTKELALLLQKGTTGASLLYLRLSKPQKFAELKIQQTALKNINKRTNGSQRSHRKGR